MQSVGINIGSSSLKMACVSDGKLLWAESIPHEGNFHEAADKILSAHPIESGAKALATGTEGRFLFSVNKTVEPLCIEEALKKLNLKADAIVSLGGEDLVVYTLNEEGRIINNFSGSKCASGTGEFFKQQLARMDMKLEDVNGVPDTARILELSTRCSVFMKSDCTHRLNKGEATKEDIVLSLSNVMAVKVIDFLKKARISKGKVILVGGITRNRHIIRFIKEKAPDIEFIIPEEASYFEALGAAYLAEKDGSPMPEADKLITKNKVSFTHLESLKTQLDKVTYFPAKHGKTVAGREYILGVD
ncbi:MAG: activase, partial [Spirochaetia bacterium]|nr:activase [Spirochaetia bacterium]